MKIREIIDCRPQVKSVKVSTWIQTNRIRNRDHAIYKYSTGGGDSSCTMVSECVPGAHQHKASSSQN